MQGRAAVLVTIAMLGGLAGCRDSGGDKSGGGISDPGITPTPTANHAPTISGKPATSAKVNTSYSFLPAASDADGDKLTFRVANKPAWASFDAATGRLYGTPTASSGGTFSNVQITVSDGKVAASLPSFSIAVADSAVIGSATLYWQPPTTNADGSVLTDLAGYKIRYGSNAAVLDQTVSLANAGLTTFVVDNLAGGIWYFTLSAVNKAGVESKLANPVSITIG